MQKSNTTAIAGVIIFGILAVGLTFYALTRNGSTPPPRNANTASAESDTPAPPANYFVASRQVLPRTRITRDMLTERQTNGNPVPPNTVTDPSQVLGQLANTIIEPGQVFTTTATVRPVTRVIPANIPVPVGLRAVAIWVNPAETAAGLVDVGDRVDVITTDKLTGTTALKGNVTFVSGRTIAQDLQVLAVDKSINAPPPGAPADDKDKKADNNAPPPNNDSLRTRLILAATAQQAQRIAAANESGTIHVTIRNPGDSVVLPTGEALEYPVRLISTAPPKPAPAPAPAKAPAPAPAPRRNNQPPPYFPQPSPQHSLPPAIATKTPTFSAPPNTREVTVIRGTTKSQVEVPK